MRPHDVRERPRLSRTPPRGSRARRRVGFLYPFLGECGRRSAERLMRDVAASILRKGARTPTRCASGSRPKNRGDRAAIAAIARANSRAGGRLLLFGNGGSATDATDWALDCVEPPAAAGAVFRRFRSRRAGNHHGDRQRRRDARSCSSRQLIAQSRPHDVAVALSTSGGSRTSWRRWKRRGSAATRPSRCSATTVARSSGAASPTSRSSFRCDFIPRIQEAQARDLPHVASRDGLVRDGA